MTPASEPTAIDPKALEDLAIFPLPGVVLFPGAVLPLHVFEPRYRALTRDALDASKLIAMTRIREPPTEPLPAVYDIAGVGLIQSARELDDGRFLILLRGVARVSIGEELPATMPYRRVRAELLPDAAPSSPDVARATEALLVEMCDKLADSITESETLRELVRLGSTPGARANLIAAALVRDPNDRQALLEMREPGARLDRLVELVSETLVELGIRRETN